MKFVVPSFGDDVTEITISRWLKGVGDTVAVDEPLLEVSTDKVDSEVLSTITGTIAALLIDEGEVASIGVEIAEVTETTEVATSSLGEPEPHPEPEVVDPGTRAAAPRMTGPTSLPTAVVDPSAHMAAPASPLTEEASGAVSSSNQLGGTRTEATSRLRRVIAERMVQSVQTSAHLTTVVEADITGIVRTRARIKGRFQQVHGVKLSFLPFLISAAVRALNENPTVNAALSADGKSVTFHEFVHLGVAVDTDRGLLVPVIRDAQALSVSQIALAIDDVARRTRENKVTAPELSGGTFTVTNTGSRGALFDTPIINQPQAAILGLGAVVAKVVPIPADDDGIQIGVRSVLHLALSYDHRLVDGADAARYLNRVKENLGDEFTDESLLV